LHFLPLHIFLGDEVLLYFIVRVKVIKIQIWFEFKLVCNLQTSLKVKREFSNFLHQFGTNPSLSSVGLLPHTAHTAQLASAGGPVSLPGTPSPHITDPTRLARSDPITI
jgi:hypothetical protein